MVRSTRALQFVLNATCCSAIIRFLSVLGFACMVTAPRAQSSIQIAQPPQEYVPFQMTVQFMKRYCLKDVAAVSEAEYSGNTLSVTLSHLFQSTPCSSTQVLNVPGLPRGRTTISVSVTERSPLLSGVDQQGATRLVETVALEVMVQPLSASFASATFWTGRFTSPTSGTGVFQLTPSRFSAFGGAWDWLEAGNDATSGFTFRAFSFATSDNLPESLSRLYVVPYPEPFAGVYWTTDVTTAETLSRAWAKPMNATQYAVGRLHNGACPIGMSPIFQTFNSIVTTHRWTQSRSAYRVMLSNGYIGEGAVWCAPALRGE